MKRSLIAVVVFAVFVLAAGASAAVRGGGNSNTTDYTIANDTPGFIKKATDAGAADSSQTIDVTVWLKLHNESQLDSLVQSQRTKGSTNYGKFIDQATFNANYAPTSQEVNSVTNFLTAHGLTVNNVSDDNASVDVSGQIGDVEKAFHVQIDRYTLDGTTYYSNTSDPNINDSSGAHIAAITGMDNYGYTPDIASQVADGASTTFTPLDTSQISGDSFSEEQCFRAPQTQTFKAKGASATYTGTRYGSDISNNDPSNPNIGHLAPCGYGPNAIRTAYDFKPLYAQGIDGSGQTIVITDAFGSPTIQQDVQTFSQTYGLPPANLTVYRAPGVWHNGSPRLGASGWADEVTLDVEWVHAMAPQAKIALVVGPTDTGSLDEAIHWAVVHDLGNTISNSWSRPEAAGNPAQQDRDNRILEEAAAKGIDVNFSTGDFGDQTPVEGRVDVNFPASSPYATAIGGTSLALNADESIRFETGWGNNETRLADMVKFGSPPVIPPLHLGFVFGAGGGYSNIYSKPTWQTGVAGSARALPDISMVADPQTGVEIIEGGSNPSVGVIGGTSLSSPLFTALMALTAEKAGHGLGQAAPLVYPLQGTSVIHDVKPFSLDNVTGSTTVGKTTTNYSSDDLAQPLGISTPYVSALYNSPFSTRWFDLTFGTDTSLFTAPGWDDVTGVGTPDAAKFVAAIGS